MNRDKSFFKVLTHLISTKKYTNIFLYVVRLAPPKKISKKFYFFLIIFLKNLFKGVGLATLSLNRYNMAQGMLRRSCVKYVNIIKKLSFPLSPPLKNSKILNFFYDIF